MKQLPLRTEVKSALEKAAPKAFSWSFCTYTDKSVSKGKVNCRIKSERSVIRKVTKAEQTKIRTALGKVAKRRGIKLDTVYVGNPQTVMGNNYKGDVLVYFSKAADTNF